MEIPIHQIRCIIFVVAYKVLSVRPIPVGTFLPMQNLVNFATTLNAQMKDAKASGLDNKRRHAEPITAE